MEDITDLDVLVEFIAAAMISRRVQNKRTRRRKRKRSVEWIDSQMNKELIALASCDGNEDRREIFEDLCRQFRGRARVTFTVFKRIVCHAEEWPHCKNSVDCCGRQAAPLSLRVYACLRYLGSGASFQIISDMSGISEPSCRQYFKFFVRNFCEKCYSLYVPMPQCREDVRLHEMQYDLLGFPGCFGSVDCVHIRWDMAAAKLTHSYAGKEHFKTLAYEVVVDHKRQILSTTHGFRGALNDKTIIRYDGFIREIRTNALFTSYSFVVHDTVDAPLELRTGAYLICDGGYHEWKCLITSLPVTTDPLRQMWSNRLESIRKDVECTFGILKKRFLFLKNAITLQKKSTIDWSFYCCCIIHNMMLPFSVEEIHQWQREMQEELPSLRDTAAVIVENLGEVEQDALYRPRRDMLIQHFAATQMNRNDITTGDY